MTPETQAAPVEDEYQPVVVRRPAGWAAGVALFSALPLDFEEERKRLLVGPVTLVGTLALVVFGIYHVLAGPVVEGWTNLAVAVVVGGALLTLRQRRDGTLFYRGVTVVFGALFIFFGTLGDPEGHRALWALTVPAFALFVAGARFGSAVSVTVFVAWILLFILPPEATGAADYPPGFVYRFVAAYVLIFVVALFTEQVREVYSAVLAQHQVRLEKSNVTLQAASERMRELALRDALTGIPNRRAIMAHLETEAARARRSRAPLTVALLDLDRFKGINDTHGHAVGDEVLVESASRILSTVRGYDRVGRYGGEEFLLVLPETDPDGAMIVLERVRSAIACAAMVAGGRSLDVTASIGAATSGEGPPDIPALLAAADRALYEAKGTGRDRVRHAARGAATMVPRG